MDVVVYKFFGAISCWELNVCEFFYGLGADKLLLGFYESLMFNGVLKMMRFQFIAGCLVYFAAT